MTEHEKPRHQAPPVSTVTFDAENRCIACGAHIAEPHSPDCPVEVRADHDAGGDCADAAITLTYQAAVYVTVGGGGVRRVTVNDQSLQLLATDGGECSGCCHTLPAEHPAVAAAAAVAEDHDTEWHCWEIGP